jgi:hypothetical protein
MWKQQQAHPTHSLIGEEGGKLLHDFCLSLHVPGALLLSLAFIHVPALYEKLPSTLTSM